MERKTKKRYTRGTKMMEDENKNTMHIEHTLQLHGSIPSFRCEIILQKDDDGELQTIIKGIPNEEEKEQK